MNTSYKYFSFDNCKDISYIRYNFYFQIFYFSYLSYVKQKVFLRKLLIKMKYHFKKKN